MNKYSAKVEPKILAVVESESGGWVYRNNLYPQSRQKNIDVVEVVENDT